MPSLALTLTLALTLALSAASQAQSVPDAQLKRRLWAEARVLVAGYGDEDRRVLGNAMVEQFIRRKDPESAAELAVELDIRDGYMFGRIAEIFVEAGDIGRAVAIASLPRDTTVRDAALSYLAQTSASRFRMEFVAMMVAAIADSSRRFDVVLQIAQQTYSRSPATASFLREWWPRVFSDTTPQGRQRAGQFAAAMVSQRDMSGWRALAGVSLDASGFFYNLVNAGNMLRSQNDSYADSAFSVAIQIIRAEPDLRKRASLEQNFWQQYVPRGGDAHWRKTADSLESKAVKQAYLSAAASRRTQEGDARTAEQIAERLFEIGDTNAARRVLQNTANSLSSAYSPNVATPLSAAMRMAQRVIDTGKPGDPANDYMTKWARALLSRVSIENVRQLAQDPAFPQMDQQIQEGAITALMNVDMQAGLALALMLPDTVRASRHLLNGAHRLVNAGMIEAALNIVERIPIAAQRAAPMAEAVQRKMQNGDTTRVRSLLTDVMPVIDFRMQYYQLSEMVVPAALRMGMLDEMLAWAIRLPPEKRAYVLVAVLGKIGG